MLIKRIVVAALTSGLLAGSVVGAAGQDGTGSPDVESFRTREIEPGVLRILDDNAGHDLTRKWPTQRRDIDHIAVSPGGQVWLSITASGDDNKRLKGARLWPLGEARTYGPKDGLGGNHNRMYFDDQGRLWVHGNNVVSFDGEEWSSTKARRTVAAPDGTVWLASDLTVESWDGTELTRHPEITFVGSLFVGPDGMVGAETWDGILHFDGSEWRRQPNADPHRAVSTDGTLAVMADNRRGLQLHREGERAPVLTGIRVNEVATAPDGSIWVAGGVGKGNGGVYRIDPAAVFAAQEEAVAAEAVAAEAAES